jgi:tRNA threonylcarbamoyladenosine biosynthesis protein TsaB
MRVLALETVGTTGTIALADGAHVVAQADLERTQRSAQSLAPGIQQLLAQAGWRPADVELVAVATGPGSFTGLRIGVTTAKLFAYAAGCPALGVDTMSAIAWRVPPEIARCSVAVDAQRGELFVADFTRRPDGRLEAASTTRVVEAEPWLATLAPGHVVTGPGLSTWSAQLPPGIVALDRERWAPTAATVAEIAARDFAAGVRHDLFALVPQYFRRTAAEEQWDKKQA